MWQDHSAGGLHDRANELLMFDVDNYLPPTALNFTKQIYTNSGNLIGRITHKGLFY